MLHKAIEFQVQGVTPLMMHNGQLADPMNPFAKAMKEITSKKNKTDEDYLKLYDLEWEGGLYLDDKGHPCIPGECVEAFLVDCGKRTRQGKAVREACLSDGNWALEYEGPKTVDAMRKHGGFRDLRKAGIKASSVQRCRGIFRKWKLTFVVHYLPDLVNKVALVDMVKVGFRVGGFMDQRPKYGRAEVLEWKELNGKE